MSSAIEYDQWFCFVALLSLGPVDLSAIEVILYYYYELELSIKNLVSYNDPPLTTFTLLFWLPLECLQNKPHYLSRTWLSWVWHRRKQESINLLANIFFIFHNKVILTASARSSSDLSSSSSDSESAQNAMSLSSHTTRIFWNKHKTVNHYSTTGLLCCDHWVRHSQHICKKIDFVTSNQDFNSTT